MISLEQLRPVALGTRDLPAAIDFAQRILGLQLIERSEHQAFFRSDDRDHTLVYFVGEPSDQTCRIRSPPRGDAGGGGRQPDGARLFRRTGNG